jgi:hypothetical protein
VSVAACGPALSGEGRCSEIFVGRSVLGPQYNEYYWRFLAKPINAAWWTRLGQLATAGLGTLGTQAVSTRLGNSTYLGKHFESYGPT